MPRTVPFPKPSPHTCPVCDDTLTAVPCPSCGAELGRPEAAELLGVDRALHDLLAQRGALVERLLFPTDGVAGAPPIAPPPPAAPDVEDPAHGGWSVAETLVGLGGLSLVAAVAVFVAVAWSDLAAWVQGGLLLAATGATVSAAAALRRRGLSATAESLGMVSVALGLADVEVVRTALDSTVTARTAWTLGLVAVAAGAVALGRTLGLRGMTAAGVALGFAPAVVALSDDRTLSHLAVVLVAQAVLGVAVAAVLRRSTTPTPDGPFVATVSDLGAATSACGAAVVAASIGFHDHSLHSPETSVVAVGVFLALAGVAVGGSVWARWRDAIAGPVLAAGALAVLIAGWFSSATAGESGAVTVVLLTSAAVALLCSAMVRLDRSLPWGVPLAVVGAVTAGLSLAPSLPVGATLVALVESSVSDADAVASTSYVDHLTDGSLLLAADLPSAEVFPQLLGVGLVGVAGMLAGRRWGRWAAIGAGLAALVALPVVVGASVAVAALVCGVAWASVVAWQLGRPGDLSAASVLVFVGTLLAGVALATPQATIVATVAMATGLGLVAVRALRADASSAPLWVAGALTVGLGGVAVDALRVGTGGSTPALLAAGAAAIASVTGPAIERWHRGDRTGAAVAADVVVGTALVLAALATRSIDAASVVTALLALVAGAHALRPTRRSLLGVALGATVVVVWLRLTAADITLLEAYTLPLAGSLLLGGALVDPAARSSWVRNGSGLLAALGPSAVVAVVDGDLVRTVGVVLGGACAVLWGAFEREQAPFAVGGTMLGAVALRHLGPVADALPRYVLFAVVGVGLLAVGATFERRRRDLRRARDAFARLG